MALNFFIHIKKYSQQKKLFAFVFTLLLLASNAVVAQNDGLSIGSSSTVEAVDADTLGVAMYKMQVKNESDEWFWGDISIFNQINTTPPLNPLIQYSLYGIPPKDSLLFVAYQPLEIQYGYKIGDNIVVIWPNSSNAITLDSLTLMLLLTKDNILNTDLVSQITNQIYYNPLNNSIVIPTALHPQIQSIKVFDLYGNLIQHTAQNYLPTLLTLPPNADNSLFFVHFMFKNGKKYVLKMLK